jgi:hypothetical protein
MVLWRVALVAVVIVAGELAAAGDEPARAEQPAAEQSAISEDAAKVEAERRRAMAALIAQLGSPRFEIREEATRKLEQSGIDAVEPLLAAAGGDSLEVTCRSIRVLGVIFDSEDDATFDAAEQALEQLAESSNRSAAQRALQVLSPLDLQGQSVDHRRYRRWKRALIRIRALGGIVKQVDAGGSEKEITEMPPEETPWLHIILEEGWKGGAAGLVNVKRIAVRLPLPLVYVTKGAKIPVEALDSLQRAMPQMRIEGRGQAMLGIKGDANAPCRIGFVVPNSAADKAGLRAGDVILKYDGEELHNFQRLVEITGERKPGDKVRLEVRREDETITVEAELTGWALEKPVDTRK